MYKFIHPSSKSVSVSGRRTLRLSWSELFSIFKSCISSQMVIMWSVDSQKPQRPWFSSIPHLSLNSFPVTSLLDLSGLGVKCQKYAPCGQLLVGNPASFLLYLPIFCWGSHLKTFRYNMDQSQCPVMVPHSTYDLNLNCFYDYNDYVQSILENTIF